MKKLRFGLTILAGTVAMLAFSSVASAQATRTWVSGVGDDVNPCSRTAPCKTFAGAISKTSTNGEIDCLDPGGFGALTITKSITIDCLSGGSGGILASGTNGINVNANAASDYIILRNLTINGAGGAGGNGINGVNVTAAHSVVLENVVISNFTTNCVAVTSSSGVTLFADNSQFLNCAGSGVLVGANAKATITRSMIYNTGLGVSQSGGGSQGLITGSTVASTGTAFQSSGGDFLGASGCTLTNNGVIFNQNGGSIYTGLDNPSFGNGATGATTAGFTKF
jgi:hypothetical protein